MSKKQTKIDPATVKKLKADKTKQVETQQTIKK